MIEPIFVPGNEAAVKPDDLRPDAMVHARDRALIWRATNLAIESAFSFGRDLPVGAVAAAGGLIVGRFFASDRRNGFKPAHAEFMAVADWQMTDLASGAPAPDTVAVTLEPCGNCQDFLATIPSLKRVVFSLPRRAVSDRGLVKPHDEVIFERALRVDLPYEVVQCDDAELQFANGVILDNTKRDPQAESVEVNHTGLQRALTELNTT